MKIVVLCDDRNGNNGCFVEHGFSLYIEHDNKKILIDFGQTEVFKKNAELLGIKLEQIDFAILTHGHYDHGNGMVFGPLNKKIFAHQEIFKDRFSLRNKQYAGLNVNKQKLLERYDFDFFSGIKYISDNIILVNNISTSNAAYFNSPSSYLENEEIDLVNDETAIILKTLKGIIVITGCSHPGICNILEHAKKVSGCEKILAIIGGFHLTKVDAKTDVFLDYIIKNNIDNIYLAHCNSDEVVEYLIKNTLQNKNYIKMFSGEQYFLK